MASESNFAADECIRAEEFPIGSDGYTFTYVNGSKIRGHRYVLQVKLGRPIRKGMVAYHTCQNRWCVNPDHILEGTPSDRSRANVIARRSGAFSRGKMSPLSTSMRIILDMNYIYYVEGRVHCLISRDML